MLKIKKNYFNTLSNEKYFFKILTCKITHTIL